MKKSISLFIASAMASVGYNDIMQWDNVGGYQKKKNTKPKQSMAKAKKSKLKIAKASKKRNRG